MVCVRHSVCFIQPRKCFLSFCFSVTAQLSTSAAVLHVRSGLVGRYIVCNYESNPDGHLSELESFDPQKKYQIVYDTDSYSYEQILHIFESHPLPNLFIGTYNRKSRTIITTDEIYRHV